MPSPKQSKPTYVEGSDRIKAYRYGNNGIRETLPIEFDVGRVIDMAQAAYAAAQLGMPKVGVDQLANKMLLEGREDAGTNRYNVNNKKAAALSDKLAALGIEGKGNAYAAAVLDKQQVADRLGIPFELAWNGTGKYVRPDGVVEADGKRHASRAEMTKGAQDDPKNAPFVDLIKRAGTGQLTPKELLATRPMDSTTQEKLIKDRLGLDVNGDLARQLYYNLGIRVDSDKWLEPILAGAVLKEKGIDNRSTRFADKLMSQQDNKFYTVPANIKDVVAGVMDRTKPGAMPFDKPGIIEKIGYSLEEYKNNPSYTVGDLVDALFSPSKK